MNNPYISRTLIVALALCSAPVFATTIDVQFLTLPADTQNGTYNGFSGGTSDGVTFTDLICDDFGHTTYFPSGDLHYDVLTLPEMSQARFGGETKALQNYENAALLVYSLENLSAVDTYLPIGQQLTVADLQYSLWDIFTPESGQTAHSSDALSILRAAPELEMPGDLDASLRIYEPSAGFESNQEFLQVQETISLQNAAPAPEPGTFALTVGMGLSLVSLILKRRVRSK